jgi:4'-phosphopantetheinyl transferase
MAVLEPGQVEVRLISLPETERDVARLRGFLTAQELQRGDRFLDPRRKTSFFAGRGVLRELLAGYLGEAPGSVRLSEGAFGKPLLVAQANCGRLCFNLSHAGDYLILAFAVGCQVGIDIENVRHDLPCRAMAQRYFSKREREELFSLPASEHVAAFYRCWTRKEAYLKAAGTGFGQPSTAFDVSLLPDQAPALLAHRARPSDPDRWRIEDLAVPDGYVAALAVEKTF